MRLPARGGGLRAKIIAWSFVPTALVLVCVWLVSLQALQRLALDLVVERDRELARLAANMLSTELVEHASRLEAVGAAVVAAKDPREAQQVLDSAETEEVFGAGVVALDLRGDVMAARSRSLTPSAVDWSDRAVFRQVLDTGRPVFSSVHPSGPTGERTVQLAVPVLDHSGALGAVMLGFLALDGTDGSALRRAVRRLPVGAEGVVVVVDENGAIVHSEQPLLGTRGLLDRVEVRSPLAGQSGALRTRDAAGGDVLAGYAPIPATSWALVTVHPWSEVTAAVQRNSRLVLALLAMGLAIPAIVVSLGVGRIIGPINELIVAAQEVAAGRFGRTIAADTGDEIEELAWQFNRMSAELERSYRELEQRVAERTRELAESSKNERRRAEQFRLISDVNQRMTRILPLDPLLEQIVQLTQAALGYDHVGIGLVEEGHVRYLYGAGPMWQERPLRFEPERLEIGRQGLSGWVAELGEPVVLPDVSKEPRYVHLEGSTTRSEMAVPILSKGRVIGVLDAQSSALDAFDQTDLAVLQAVAGHAGVVIENSRLYTRARQAAVLEERQRMARDLHDSVTQSLYGVTLYGDAAARLLEAGDVDGATEHCNSLRQTAKEALAEMRLLIFELRPAELERVGLIGALQARIDAVEARAGLSAELEADPALRLALAVEEALYRIAQEALNNVLKHARASRVLVRIFDRDTRLVMEIVDDGIGFDPEATGGGGIGLHSMSERAEQVGGLVRIESHSGTGTRVQVEVPL